MYEGEWDNEPQDFYPDQEDEYSEEQAWIDDDARREFEYDHPYPGDLEVFFPDDNPEPPF